MNHSNNPVLDNPTVDELEALKRLELEGMNLPEALHRHLSERLLEYAYVTVDGKGTFVLTDKGRALIRRQGN